MTLSSTVTERKQSYRGLPSKNTVIYSLSIHIWGFGEKSEERKFKHINKFSNPPYSLQKLSTDKVTCIINNIRLCPQGLKTRLLWGGNSRENQVCSAFLWRYSPVWKCFEHPELKTTSSYSDVFWHHRRLIAYRKPQALYKTWASREPPSCVDHARAHD